MTYTLAHGSLTFGQSEYMSVHTHTPQTETRQLRPCVCARARASVWQGQQLTRVQEKEEECGLEELVPSHRPCLGTCRVSGSVLGSMRCW